MKRQRGRGRRSGGGNNNPNKHFESNGPDVKIRGSAQQILDKYLQYARDAQTSGDRVNAENYLQHAEHYLRLIATMQPKEKPRDPNQDQKSGETSQTASQTEGAEASAVADADGAKEPREGGGKGERGRRRQRPNKPRDQAEARTISDEVEAESPVNGDAALSKTDAAEPKATEEAPAPKRRRAPRKPKVVAAEAEGEAPQDGIMKTLSRGRKPKADSVADDAAAPTAEAAD